MIYNSSSELWMYPGVYTQLDVPGEAYTSRGRRNTQLAMKWGNNFIWIRDDPSCSQASEGNSPAGSWWGSLVLSLKRTWSMGNEMDRHRDLACL